MFLAGDYVPQASKLSLEIPDEFLLCNLEAPVLGDQVLSPIKKAGISLKTRSLGGLPGKKIFCIANNHIMDYGEAGLIKTINEINKNGLFATGAGRTLMEARKPVFFSENDVKFAILGCCERQFGVAEYAKAGVCELGLWMLPVVGQLKKQADIVIISCHAALEFSPWPSPRLRSFYKALIDAGADIIHGHHSHVPQGIESYRHGVIFYGLGNFVVQPQDWRRNPAFLWSVIIKLNVDRGRIVWVPFYCEVATSSDGTILVRLSSPEEIKTHNQYMTIANKAFLNELTCEAYWQEAAIRFYHRLYARPLGLKSIVNRPLSPKNRVYFGLTAIMQIIYMLIGREFRTERGMKLARMAYNFFNCHSHTDAIATAMGVLLGEREDLRSKQTAEDAISLNVGVI